MRRFPFIAVSVHLALMTIITSAVESFAQARPYAAALLLAIAFAFAAKD